MNWELTLVVCVSVFVWTIIAGLIGCVLANRARNDACIEIAPKKMDEHDVKFASDMYAILRIQQHEQQRLVAENEELRARINRLEEWLAKVEAESAC